MTPEQQREAWVMLDSDVRDEADDTDDTDSVANMDANMDANSDANSVDALVESMIAGAPGAHGAARG
ncbi:MAG: hypothetical protein IPK13_27490 [Deltaproteobacteria bacterium]|nr:hypothetical protein [Deltaproteobacteria bacterium]